MQSAILSFQFQPQVQYMIDFVISVTPGSSIKCNYMYQYIVKDLTYNHTC